jgi:hypothetical protein
MSDKLYIIYLIYTEQHRDSGIKLLRKFIARIFPKHQIEFIVVENKCDFPAEFQFETDATQINGDNTVREFTGFECGLEWAMKRKGAKPSDTIILVNDTFHRSYGSDYLDLFKRKEVAQAIAKGAFIGYTDAYPKPVEVFGLKVQRWIRTSLIIGPCSSFLKVSPFGVTVDSQFLFSGESEKFFAPTAPLSENYQQYLKTWLFSKENDGEFKESWHSKKELTQENLLDFQGKARAIFSEHFFSARAQALGIPIYDVREKQWVSSVQ